MESDAKSYLYFHNKYIKHLVFTNKNTAVHTGARSTSNIQNSLSKTTATTSTYWKMCKTPIALSKKHATTTIDF